MSTVLEPPRASAATLRSEVLAGLSRTPKSLPTKLLYDATGARLFEEITRLDEYYVTRTERSIFEDHVSEIARWVGPRARVVEPGSGSGEKTRVLLESLDDPVAYVPVDIAGDQLRTLATVLDREHPRMEVLPVRADYTRWFDIPVPERIAARTVIFFPGSTIGNFEPDSARAFLRLLAEEAGPGGALILGADLRKPADVLIPAYNDREGVTAAFNRNVLRHVNRVVGSDFDIEAFRHDAPWVPDESRIEMHLVSRKDQCVRLPGSNGSGAEDEVHVSIREGESIVTEYSYKHSPDALDRLVEDAGWVPRKEWRDDRGWFSVRFSEVA